MLSSSQCQLIPPLPLPKHFVKNLKNLLELIYTNEANELCEAKSQRMWPGRLPFTQMNCKSQPRFPYQERGIYFLVDIL